MTGSRFIAYYRVSTDRQGRSGLGLEAQAKAVTDHIASIPGATILAEFTEVETGKRADRPQLAKALEQCRRTKATLIIAKLDRLARNARFLLGIVESGVDTFFCDLPALPPGAIGKFMLTQMAAVAELEAGMVSQRTKAALAARKARGLPLGWALPGRDDHIRATAKAVDANRSRADLHAQNIAPVIANIRAAGVSTLQGIADALNARGIQTARGGAWHPATVRNLLARAAAT